MPGSDPGGVTVTINGQNRKLPSQFLTDIKTTKNDFKQMTPGQQQGTAKNWLMQNAGHY